MKILLTIIFVCFATLAHANNPYPPGTTADMSDNCMHALSFYTTQTGGDIEAGICIGFVDAVLKDSKETDPSYTCLPNDLQELDVVKLFVGWAARIKNKGIANDGIRDALHSAYPCYNHENK